jgi:hypothetical protein
VGVSIRTEPGMTSTARPPASRGAVTGAGALLLMFVVAGGGAVVDLFTGPGGLRRVFAVSLVAGAVLAALLVRHRGLWTVLITPPLLYVVMSLLSTLAAPEGVFDSTSKLWAALVGWLVYGFPEIAVSTGLAAVIAGIRYASRPRGR